MNRWRTCACVLGALLLTGCTAAGAAEHAASQGTSHPPTRATGHLTGKLFIEGGPIGPGGKQPGERPIPGTVTLTAAGHRPVTITVGNSGRFSAWLPPAGTGSSGARRPSLPSRTRATRSRPPHRPRP